MPKAPPPSVGFITSEKDVDVVVKEVFGPRNPPVPMDFIAGGWKAIVADGLRPPVKVIYDTDIGTDVDDAIALAFGLLRPELDIIAITTSRGETDKRAAIVSRMLQVMNRTDIPFAAGSKVMFNGEVMRDKPVNQFPYAGPDHNRPKPSCSDAQELLIKTIKANWGEVWMVIVGPFTNAAILLRDHPEVAKGLKGIVCMGGEVTRAFPETNIKHDPEAAEVVTRAGLLKFAGTYDVTIQILVPKTDIERLKRLDTPVSKMLLELIGYWREARGEKPGGPVVFDMCPLVWLFAPEMFTTVQMGIKCESQPAERRGVMSADPAGPLSAIPTAVNAVGIHRMLMDTIASARA